MLAGADDVRLQQPVIDDDLNDSTGAIDVEMIELVCQILVAEVVEGAESDCV